MTDVHGRVYSGILHLISLSMIRRFALLGLAVALSVPFITHAADDTTSDITLKSGEETHGIFTPFSDTAPGTIGSIAIGDLGGDGVEEILVGAGAGMPPTIAVFRQDGSRIGSFLAYDAAFTRGVNVAVCDVDGDGANDIVTGAKFGGGPHVRVFDAMGNATHGFFAYDTAFRGGVNVSCGDLDHDGTAEIITGAGLSGGPHIKVMDANGYLYTEIFNGSATANTGAYVAAKDDAVYAVAMAGTDNAVRMYRMDQNALIAEQTVTDITRDVLSTTATFADGTVAIADTTSDLAADTSSKYIKVDVSEQRLTAYEYGVEVNTFLISSGTYTHPTPYGKTPITAKLPVHQYGGIDYWYPNVKWNMRFRPHYYIHTAYWHNNFGQRMSHGCINVRLDDADWIYHWADIGTSVEIIP